MAKEKAAKDFPGFQKPKWRVKIHPEPEAVVEAWGEQEATDAYCELMGVLEYAQDSLQVCEKVK